VPSISPNGSKSPKINQTALGGVGAS